MTDAELILRICLQHSCKHTKDLRSIDYVLKRFYTVTTAFVERPTTLMVAPGMQATFRCQHESPATIGWRVNGTSINQLPNRDIIPGNVHNNCGQLVNNLSIVTIPEYNGTEVVCVAIFSNGSSEASPKAVLIIQEGC